MKKPYLFTELHKELPWVKVRSKSVNIVFRLTRTLIVALLFAYLIRLFVFSAYIVDGESMLPNLHTGERIIINKMVYQWKTPVRNDIIVMDSAEHIAYVKRVIALPGETVEVKGDTVWINDQPIAQPYLEVPVQQAQRRGETYNTNDFVKTVVPAGHVFVMGDNRPYSYDSRSFGFVSLTQIVGRVDVLYWPFHRAQML